MSTRSIDALDVLLGADRDLGGDDVRAERPLELLERAEEVGALAVEHVHEQHPRDVELGRARPQPAGGDLDAHHGVDDEHRRLAHAQRAQRVRHEARLAGRVQQVDLALLPLERAERRGDRHLARLLVGVGVRHGAVVGDRAQARVTPGLEQQRLVQRRLPRPSVTDEGDVANTVRCVVHESLPFSGESTIPPSRARAPRSRVFRRIRGPRAGPIRRTRGAPSPAAPARGTTRDACA